MDYNVGLDKIKLIERYGVSCYEKEYEPEIIGQTKFEWKCEIVTSNKRLCN